MSFLGNIYIFLVHLSSQSLNCRIRVKSLDSTEKRNWSTRKAALAAKFDRKFGRTARETFLRYWRFGRTARETFLRYWHIRVPHNRAPREILNVS